MKAMQEMPPQFSHHNKGFINYVFCRNWAVRNPAGTRLDSSLVTKQVGFSSATLQTRPGREWAPDGCFAKGCNGALATLGFEYSYRFSIRGLCLAEKDPDIWPPQ